MLDDNEIKIVSFVKSNGGDMLVDKSISECLSIPFDELQAACEQLNSDGFFSEKTDYIDGTCYVALSYKGYQIANCSIAPVNDCNHVADGKPVHGPNNKRFKKAVEILKKSVKAIITFISILASIITIWAVLH